MRVLITGNRHKDLCSYVVPLLESEGHACTCVSRSTGFDFEKDDGAISKVVKLAADHDVFINMYANFFFQASVLTQKVFSSWNESGHGQRRIITVGSTTDRVRRGKTNLYHYEKLALRELSSGLAIAGVWENAPKVTHISLGTLANRAANNPGRRCLPMETAAKYFLWILQQPAGVHINEISVDPIQGSDALL
jgi:NADP-dependent 3-hydroxy acid dehydrogenase YdfG